MVLVLIVCLMWFFGSVFNGICMLILDRFIVNVWIFGWVLVCFLLFLIYLNIVISVLFFVYSIFVGCDVIYLFCCNIGML